MSGSTRVDAALVGADEHAALPDVAQVGDGAGRLVGQPQQPRARSRAAARRRRSACRRATSGRSAARPAPSSSRRMAWLTAGCVRRSLRAAREKLRSAATVAKTRRSSNVMCRSVQRQASTIRYATTNLKIITLTFGTPRPTLADPMADRLIIFDTTLRDGEQAPGFSMRVDEKVRLARQLEALGVDIIEAGFPIASEADAEAVRRVALALERPVVAALARCAPGDVDRAAWAIAPARRGRIHTFIATSDLHLAAQAAHDARGVPRRRRRRGHARARRTPTTWSSRPRTRRAATSTSSAASSRRSSTAGATTINLPDTVGYSTPDEIAAFFRTVIGARAERGPRDLQRALPRRPRPGGREHAGGDRRRRAAGRVHDQRHRRARRQRVARRDRDGRRACVRIGCRSRPASTRRSSSPRASC